MTPSHTPRPGLNNPTAAVAVAVGLIWLVAIALRAAGWIGWSWWLVMSPPFLIAGVFALYVLLALSINGFYLLAAWFTEWRDDLRRQAEQKKVTDYYRRQRPR